MTEMEFDDIGADYDGNMLVYAKFLNGEELIGYGDSGLEDILARLGEDQHMEIKGIYHEVRTTSLGNFKFNVSFSVDENGNRSSVSNLKVVLDGQTFELGSYGDFVDHNGMLGLRYSYRTHKLWDEAGDIEAA